MDIMPSRRRNPCYSPMQRYKVIIESNLLITPFLVLHQHIPHTQLISLQSKASAPSDVRSNNNSWRSKWPRSPPRKGTRFTQYLQILHRYPTEMANVRWNAPSHGTVHLEWWACQISADCCLAGGDALKFVFAALVFDAANQAGSSDTSSSILKLITQPIWKIRGCL